MINMITAVLFGHAAYSALILVAVAIMLWCLSTAQEKRSVLPASPAAASRGGKLR